MYVVWGVPLATRVRGRSHKIQTIRSCSKSQAIRRFRGFYSVKIEALRSFSHKSQAIRRIDSEIARVDGYDIDWTNFRWRNEWWRLDYALKRSYGVVWSKSRLGQTHDGKVVREICQRKIKYEISELGSWKRLLSDLLWKWDCCLRTSRWKYFQMRLIWRKSPILQKLCQRPHRKFG